MAAEQQAKSGAEIIQHHLQNLTIGDPNSFWSLNLDTLFFSIILGASFCGFLYYISKKLQTGVPSFAQNLAEMIFDFVDNNIKEFLGESRRDIGSLAMAAFLWVLLWNTMDLIPVDLLPAIAEIFGIHHLKIVPSTDMNATFAISITVVSLTYVYAFKNNHGFIGLLRSMGTHPFEAPNLIGKVLLFPLNFLLRLVEDIAKLISLSLRLYGNLFAGELIFILISLLPVLVQFLPGGIWAIFHILVVCIQAYVVMVLSVVYLSLVQAHH